MQRNSNVSKLEESKVIEIKDAKDAYATTKQVAKHIVFASEVQCQG